jgi:alkylhydroperoxidase/carboxymuconolactone decarboxylase family protein YurZ
MSRQAFYCIIPYFTSKLERKIMSSREILHQRGKAIRDQLQHQRPSHVGTVAVSDVPGVPRLVTEVAFGAVWSRPGLNMSDRMICTLAVLSSVQHLPQLRTYLHSALNLDIPPRSLQEIFIQCSIYTGFPSMVNSLEVAREVFEARHIEVPPTTLPDYSLDELDTLGREVMQILHGERSQQGYASPDNTVTAALYPVAIQYGYGDIWRRPDLDYRLRMICALGSFTALNLVMQLEKFLQAALNVGLSKAEIIEVIIQTAPYSGFPKALNALAIAGKVLQ